MIQSFWDIFYVPLGWLMQLCYRIVPNYGVALLFFAILLKLLLSPFSIKQQRNSIKQAKLYPYERALKKKYNADKINRNPQLQTPQDKLNLQKMQMEQSELYQKFGYNPLSGCLPMLIQLPLLIFIYNVIRSPLRYLCGVQKAVVEKIKAEAGVADEISALRVMKADFARFEGIEGMNLTADKLPDFNMFGLDMTVTPKFGMSIYILIPLITFVVVYLSGHFTRKFMYQPPREGQSESALMSMKIMNMTMPLMTVFITFGVPSIVGIYWLYQNALGVLQQFILSKAIPVPEITEEDIKEAERVVNGRHKKKKKKPKDPDRPRVRSLHHIDDDEYNAKVVTPPEGTASATKTTSAFIEPVKTKSYNSGNQKKKK